MHTNSSDRSISGQGHEQNFVYLGDFGLLKPQWYLRAMTSNLLVGMLSVKSDKWTIRSALIVLRLFHPVASLSGPVYYLIPRLHNDQSVSASSLAIVTRTCNDLAVVCFAYSLVPILSSCYSTLVLLKSRHAIVRTFHNAKLRLKRGWTASDTYCPTSLPYVQAW